MARFFFARKETIVKAAVYCATRNVYPTLVPAVKSLMAHSDVEKIYLVIEDDVLPFRMPEICETINVRDQRFFRPDGPNFRSKWSWMVLMRCALTKILPQDLERVLSLDIDTIVEMDISDLWDLDLTGWYLAAVREPAKSTPKHSYFNAGVVMYNLQELRDGMDDRIIRALNETPYECTDQDALNELCRHRIKRLPGDYNCSDFTDAYRLRKIVHFAAIPDWSGYPEVEKYRAMPWEEVCRCGL